MIYEGSTEVLSNMTNFQKVNLFQNSPTNATSPFPYDLTYGSWMTFAVIIVSKIALEVCPRSDTS